MEHRRKTERAFDYLVLVIAAGIFIAILEVMSRQNIKPEVLTVLGGALTMDLGFIGLAAAHLWNAQKKSDGIESRKDAAPPTIPAAPPAQEVKP